MPPLALEENPGLPPRGEQRRKDIDFRGVLTANLVFQRAEYGVADRGTSGGRELLKGLARVGHELAREIRRGIELHGRSPGGDAHARATDAVFHLCDRDGGAVIVVRPAGPRQWVVAA